MDSTGTNPAHQARPTLMTRLIRALQAAADVERWITRTGRVMTGWRMPLL